MLKHPYELNCSKEIGHKTKLIPLFHKFMLLFPLSFRLFLLLLPCNIWKYFFPKLVSSFPVDLFVLETEIFGLFVAGFLQGKEFRFSVAVI